MLFIKYVSDLVPVAWLHKTSGVWGEKRAKVCHVFCLHLPYVTCLATKRDDALDRNTYIDAWHDRIQANLCHRRSLAQLHLCCAAWWSWFVSMAMNINVHVRLFNRLIWQRFRTYGAIVHIALLATWYNAARQRLSATTDIRSHNKNEAKDLQVLKNSCELLWNWPCKHYVEWSTVHILRFRQTCWRAVILFSASV